MHNQIIDGVVGQVRRAREDQQRAGGEHAVVDDEEIRGDCARAGLIRRPELKQEGRAPQIVFLTKRAFSDVEARSVQQGRPRRENFSLSTVTEVLKGCRQLQGFRP
jgi:hypothetical protein